VCFVVGVFGMVKLFLGMTMFGRIRDIYELLGRVGLVDLKLKCEEKHLIGRMLALYVVW
jgi:hypothetical protein